VAEDEEEPTKGKLEEDELEKDVTATLEEPVPASNFVFSKFAWWKFRTFASFGQSNFASFILISSRCSSKSPGIDRNQDHSGPPTSPSSLMNKSSGSSMPRSRKGDDRARSTTRWQRGRRS